MNGEEPPSFPLNERELSMRAVPLRAQRHHEHAERTNSSGGSSYHRGCSRGASLVSSRRPTASTRATSHHQSSWDRERAKSEKGASGTQTVERRPEPHVKGIGEQFSSEERRPLEFDEQPLPYNQDIIPDADCPAYRDFKSDPAHRFWTWSEGEQQWFHKDQESDAVLWAPLELD